MIKYLTPEGLEKFKKELNYLKTVKRKEIAERIGYTASFGDLSENFAYQQAKEDQTFLERDILKLEEIIRQVKVIEKKKTGKVEIGSVVLVKAINGKQKFYPAPKKLGLDKFIPEIGGGVKIVGPEEADPSKGKISFESPLGSAILNKKKGDIAEIDTQEGKKEYEIVEIR